MRTLLLTLLFFCITGTALAQFPNKFYIGAFWVGGNSDSTWIEGPGYVRYLDSLWSGTNWQSTYQTGRHTLPVSRFDELEDLGLNMAGINIEHTNGLQDPDLPHKINAALEGPYVNTENEKEVDVCYISYSKQNKR